MESCYEIREDVVDAVKRVKAVSSLDGHVSFNGWARMAVPIKEFRLTEVKNPNIGETKPAQVKANVEVDYRAFTGSIREGKPTPTPTPTLLFLNITFTINNTQTKDFS